MTAFLKKMIGKDPLTKTYKEFESLVALEAKRKNILMSMGLMRI